jgi:hypothetical protein
MKITTVKVNNVMKREQANEMIKRLTTKCKSFHNFTFHACPAYGSLDIIAETDYDFSEDGEEIDQEKEMLSTLVFLLSY